MYSIHSQCNVFHTSRFRFIVKELLNTERIYIRDLEICIQVQLKIFTDLVIVHTNVLYCIFFKINYFKINYFKINYFKINKAKLTISKHNLPTNTIHSPFVTQCYRAALFDDDVTTPEGVTFKSPNVSNELRSRREFIFLNLVEIFNFHKSYAVELLFLILFL